MIRMRARLRQRTSTPASAWIKALVRTAASTVRDTFQPLQLGFGVSGGVETLVLGLRLWFEKQVANSVTAVVVSIDLKNAHNSFSRTKCMEALKAAATKTFALWRLVVAWHAMTFQNYPIYVCDTSEPNGWSFLCSSA